MREISVRVFDDLDFTRDGQRNEAVVTVTVGLNGTWRELDLTEANEKYVRGTLDPLMDAGREPDEAPKAPPGKRVVFTINPERSEFLEGLREWCKSTHRMNKRGTGWAYQTNESLKYYYGDSLIRAYQDYLAGQEKKG